MTNGNVNKSNEREHQFAIEAQANDPNLMYDEDQVDALCPTPDISQLINVKKTERNKFFGSLPNHLDSDETYRENSKHNFLFSNFIHLIGLLNMHYFFFFYSRTVYNKSNTQETTQKRPFVKAKLECENIQYPSSSPRPLPYSQPNQHQNAKSSTSNGMN